jgi:hypothetical protein
MRGQSVAPIPDTCGGQGIGAIACRLVASNRATLTFFEGENIVPHPQNPHVCDGLVALN